MATNWKVGDKAKCIRVGGPEPGVDYPHLRLNFTYIVAGIHICECGCVSLDVGLGLADPSKGCNCNCGAKSSPKTGIRWCHSNRFVKEIEDNAEAIAEAVAEENYELAAKLRDGKL